MKRMIVCGCVFVLLLSGCSGSGLDRKMNSGKQVDQTYLLALSEATPAQQNVLRERMTEVMQYLTFKTMLLFNLWGFLFGPFYYLAKGLWKKAIVLFVLSSALIFVVALALQKLGMNDPLIPNVIGPIIFAVRANLDYYKKKVLGDNGWW